eukprot:jgi/Botrbrau1/16620/Bobra.0068s0046.1
MFSHVPHSCSIEVQVQKVCCALFVAETVRDSDSTCTFANAINKANITSDILGSAKRLWTCLELEGPIKKVVVKKAVDLFTKGWKASKTDFVMRGCPGSDTLHGLVINAYFHMHKVGKGWLDNSQGMALSICKIWTSQAICVNALRTKVSVLPSSPTLDVEYVNTALWVYMTSTTLPAAILATIIGNASNMVFTCNNVIDACIFMANEAHLGCTLPDISDIANEFKKGLDASEEIPQIVQDMMQNQLSSKFG